MRRRYRWSTLRRTAVRGSRRGRGRLTGDAGPNWYHRGTQGSRLRGDYGDFSGTSHCVGVGNGTDAVEMPCARSASGPGDECIMPANTFIATAEAVCRAGAAPVLADCADDDTYLVDPHAVAAALTRRTRAIMPVHLYGQAAPVELLAPMASGQVPSSGRTPRRPRGPAVTAMAPGLSATPPRLASTRGRTSAPTAIPGRC